MHTRIAPTPSGYLHAGNACSFLLTRQLATRYGGTLRLRIDDIDNDRTRPEHFTDIFETLRLLEIEYEYGPVSVLDFQQNFAQHLRLPLYKILLNDLLTTGLVYACFCTRKQLLENAGRCNCEKKNIPLDAENVAWRIHIPDKTIIKFKDRKLGIQYVDLVKEMPSFVIRKRDGLPAYQIVSLADDLYYDTTCIIRGYDLMPSTAAQLFLAQLTGRNQFLAVAFYHHPLLIGLGGEKLSKSAGDTSVKKLLQSGIGRKELQAIVDGWI